MKLQLIFTLDYELFGDASGSVMHEQIKPTNQLLDIFDEYNAKLSIFFEYGQYLGYEKFSSSKNQFKEENGLLTSQLIDAVKRGHDVQFHYHPTWYNAIYKNQKICLDTEMFDISDMEDSEIDEIVGGGKVFLENLLKPINDRYKCNTFRAGAWSMNNSKRVLPIFKKHDFKCDTSVAPYAKFSSSYGEFDYRDASSSYEPWFIDISSNSLTRHSKKKEFLELPIYTRKSSFGFLKYFNPHYLKSKKVISKFYKTKVSEVKMNRVDKMKKILSRDYYMADFNTMDSKTLYKMIQEVIVENRDGNKTIPIVLIGHSKSSYFNDELHLLFQKLETLDCIEYKNISEVVEEFL
jgi:hypothetical protein